MKEMLSGIIEILKEGELVDAFDLANLLDWGDGAMPLYKKIKEEYVSRPLGFDENELRKRLMVHLQNTFTNSQDTVASSSFLAMTLLEEDFVPQKKLLHSKKRKHNIILLQGTQDCGLQYFVLWKHQNNCSLIPVRANQISSIDNEAEFWDKFVQFLNLQINIRNTKKDIPSAVASKIEEQLKEKPIVLIIYNTEFWQSNYKTYLNRMTEYLTKLPLEEEVAHGFYCYFIHTGIADFAGFDENLIVLPPISELEENEVNKIYCNRYEFFTHCDREGEGLFEGRKKLSEVIEIFIKHSSCGQEIAAYLNKRLSF